MKIAALLLLAIACLPAAERRPIAVIAHRGEHLRHVENTLPAFQAAIDAGADYFECDVRTTSDGRLVLMHDATVDRTTNGHGAVAGMTFAEIRALDAHGNSVPTFEEALKLARGHIGIYVDNKQTTPEALTAAIAEAGMGDHVMIYTGPEEARRIQALRPAWKVMPEASSPAHLRDLIESLHLRAAAFDAGDFKPETIAEAVRAGVDIYVDRLWLQDHEAAWQDAIDAGAAGIQTDHPAELVQYLRGKGLHR